MTNNIRHILGTFVFDWPRFLWCLRLWSQNGWIYMKNRNDDLDICEKGIKCNWEFTRPLHLCNVFPFTSSIMLSKALQQYPISTASHPAYISNSKICSNEKYAPDVPEVSFLIGHRGIQRLLHLLLTLKTIAAQKGVCFECIVVEQDNEPLIENQLPSWVRYIHSPLPEKDMAYSRSRAFNVGSLSACGSILICHDNDMLIPESYGKEIFSKIKKDGYEAINLKRFIFYTNEKSAHNIFRSGSITNKVICEKVIENLEAGGSFAITQKSFFHIGGFDEEFIGWGGEDNEFWDRCLTLKVWQHTYMPIIHLWHPWQVLKYDTSNPTTKLLENKRLVPSEKRIRLLKNG